MERKELYAKIQQLGLQDEVKKTYGKNYTMVSNDNLEQIIWNYDAPQASKCPDLPQEQEAATVPCASAQVSQADDTTQTEDAYDAACLVFLGILKDSGRLDSLLAKL